MPASNFDLSHNISVNTLIIGAGPTGLGAACHLDDVGDPDWLLVDASSGPGGMAATIVDDKGFRWDLGGHVICSHFEEFDAITSRHQAWASPSRGGWVRLNGTWCPTPIQQNLGSIAQGRQIAQELGNTITTLAGKETNLENYYKSRFGPTLNEAFFSPFNSKQWGWPLQELSHTWTSLRSGSKAPNVPEPRSDSVFTVKDTPDDTSRFPYPSLGTGTLWQSVADALPKEKQLYGVTVTYMDLGRREATLSTGSTVTFNRCISTMPLTSLLSIINPKHPSLAVYSHELLFTSTHIVGFGFSGPLPKVLAGKTWIFSADRSVPFHRATIPTNFSQCLSGEGRWSIMFETSISKKRELSPDSLAEKHLEELRRWGIHDQPISTWQHHVHFGYPLPFLGRDDLLHEILSQLEEYNVYSRGRFGGWRYESSNQDYAFIQGVEVARYCRDGTPEETYWPDRRAHLRGQCVRDG